MTGEMLGKRVERRIDAVLIGEVAAPIRPELRSLNVAVAAAMVMGEALRQARP